MGLFRRKDSVPKGPTEVVVPDPPAFAPIPPPAPYRPALYYPADRQQDHLAVQDHWARETGDESNVPPVRRRRRALDTEYARDLSLAAQDGIGHTEPGYQHGQLRAPDVRLDGVDPSFGRRPDSMVRNQDTYTYFRPYQQDTARNWPGLLRESPGLLENRGVRQGNFASRQWRLTARFDPTLGESYDRTPAAATSRITEYNAASTVRRSFRL